MVKTTPKPRATKNNKGELVGPLLLLLLAVVVALGTAEVVEDMSSESVKTEIVERLKRRRKNLLRKVFVKRLPEKVGYMYSV